MSQMAKVPASFSIDEKFLKKIKDEAESTERTKSQIVEFALREYFARKDEKEAGAGDDQKAAPAAVKAPQLQKERKIVEDPFDSR
jgi:predicted transcriptional regulator